MKKITASILTTLLMLSMVFSSSVFAANEEVSAWDSFLGLFSAKASADEVGVEYRGHIENKGDFPLDNSWIQGPTELGTRGESLRMEGFWIRLTDAPAGLNIKYNVHVQNEGWLADEDDTTNWIENGDFCGTRAKGQRIEAVKIVLVDDEGNLSTDYDVMYQGHVQNVGDLPANGTWFMNGVQLGTVGASQRLEALKVKIVQKEADLTAYNAAKAAVAQADYTAASWTTYKAVVDANVVTADNLQSEVDAATAAITAAQANLVKLLKVESVSANNLNQITVVFTREVDKTTAETVGNYEVGGAALTSVDKIELQADKKTAVINLGGTPKAQYAKAAFKVKGSVVYGENKIETVPVYTSELTFVDTQVPTVKSVTASGNKKVIVEFSEPVTLPVNNATAGLVTAGGTKFKLDGQYVTNYGFTQAVAKNVATATGPIYYTNKVELEFATSLAAGTHTLTVLASDGSTFFQDAAAFSLVETPVEFSISSVVDAPQIVSIEAQDNGTIYITYDRSMSANAYATNTYYVNDSSTALSAGSFKDGTDSKVVKLTASNVSVGANVLKITKNLVTDTYGNKLNATTDLRTSFTATADTTKPTVTSVTPITNTKVRVKFSEDVNSIYATTASNYTVKNASGTKVTGFTVSGSADTYDINFGTALTGSNYTLIIKNIVDTAKTPNVMDEYTTTFNGVDDVKPEVVSNQAIKSDARKAVITFTEAMDVSTISNAANYLYKGGDGTTYNLPSGTTLAPSDDTKSVEITFPTSYAVEVTTGASGTTQYFVQQLLVSNVKDAGGNVLKNVSSGLMNIVAATSGTAPTYVAETFKLSAVSGKVTAEFEMDQTITNLDPADFKVAGEAPNSAYMSGKKVVLEFTDTTASTGNIAVIKAAGITADLDTIGSPNSKNAYGTPIAVITDQVVYEDAIAPELLSIVKDTDSKKIKVVFTEAIDDTILGLYTNDFTVQSAGTMLTINSVDIATTGGVTDNTLVLNLNQSVGSGDTLVKAASTVDIRDLKDTAGNYNVYVPTTSDKDGTNGTLTYAYAAAPSAVGLTAGTTGAAITHDVAIPAAGVTDTSGIVDWTASTGTDIVFTVTDSSGVSTITVDNGLGGGPVSYTSAANYTIASGVTSLTFVVTTTEANAANAVRTFTVAVN